MIGKFKKWIVILFMLGAVMCLSVFAFLGASVSKARQTVLLAPVAQGGAPVPVLPAPDQVEVSESIQLNPPLPMVPEESADDRSQEEFFMSCQGIPLYALCSEISSYFDVNILVFDDIKERLVYGDIKGTSLKQVLDCISWFLDAEYVLKDEIYYIGSNSKVVLVLPSAGVDKNIENFFVDVSLKNIGDKIVIYGSEREVAKVRQVYDDIISRKICKVKLYAIEIQHEQQLDLGIDIDKSVKYAFSWEALAANAYNPIQTLAVSLKASVQADSSAVDLSSLIDTDLGLVSGQPLRLQAGEDIDRPIYSQSDYGDRVVSGYSTQKTGLMIELSAYYDKESWVLSFQVENSEAKSDVKKTLTTLKTTAILSSETPVIVLAKLNAGKNSIEYQKGIPYLADIPYLGYCFRVTTEKVMDRTIYFIVQLLDVDSVVELPDRLPEGELMRFRRLIQQPVDAGGRGTPASIDVESVE